MRMARLLLTFCAVVSVCLVGCGETFSDDFDALEPAPDTFSSPDVQTRDNGQPDPAGDSDSAIEAGGTDAGSFPDDVGADAAGSDIGSDADETGLYSVLPVISSCSPGVITDYQKNIVLERVNYIRSLHGLQPVWYNDEGDELTAACSLVSAVNRQLSHFPGQDWICWSQNAADGCKSSNIYLQWGMDPDDLDSREIVDGFITDEGVDTLGHRRWLIDPWLDHISFSRVDDFAGRTTGSAIKVFNDEMADISDTSVEMVASPYHDYPAKLYGAGVMMSFSVVSTTSNKWDSSNKNVDFSSASVTIVDSSSSNREMQVSEVFYDNEGYGVPNNLRWYTKSIETGVRYDVTVSDVNVEGVRKSFSYWFRLDPSL